MKSATELALLHHNADCSEIMSNFIQKTLEPHQSTISSNTNLLETRNKSPIPSHGEIAKKELKFEPVNIFGWVSIHS